MSPNLDPKTVEGFGTEWGRFDQEALSEKDRTRIFSDYFALFPWHRLPLGGGQGADIGCGSGRWAAMVAPRVAALHCVDASKAAIAVAQARLTGVTNVSFHVASVDALPFAEASLDFAYSLGVLHHVPDTSAAIRSVAAKLKPDAPFLLYLYYSFENRPAWFRTLWRCSDFVRRVVARLPDKIRYLVSQLLAAVVYWPLARAARALERLRCLPAHWPLASYRERDFYVMRNDALDRFGTRLERRFRRSEIESMLKASGFAEVTFSDNPPYWCVVAVRR